MTPPRDPHTPPDNGSLLSKANSLIHRNRVSKVDFELDDDPPILMEAIDDLPELTDELDTLQDSIDDDVFDPLATHIVQPSPSVPPLWSAAPVPPQTVTVPVLPENITPASSFKHETESGPVLPLNVPPIDIFSDGTPAEPAPYITAAGISSALPTSPVPGISQDDLNKAVAEALEQAQTDLDKAVTRAVDQTKMQVVEHLINLDAYLAQALDAWMEKEIPSLIQGELEGMVERLRVKTTAHMRATLLPELSAKLSEVLENTQETKK